MVSIRAKEKVQVESQGRESDSGTIFKAAGNTK